MGGNFLANIKRFISSYAYRAFSPANTPHTNHSISDSLNAPIPVTAREELSNKQNSRMEDRIISKTQVKDSTAEDWVAGLTSKNMLLSTLINEKPQVFSEIFIDQKVTHCVVEVKVGYQGLENLFLKSRLTEDELSMGLIEFKSIAVGIKTCDQMLKSAPVNLLEATSICPGKFIVIICGDAVSVDYAMKKAQSVDDGGIEDILYIPNIDKQVVSVLSGESTEKPDYDSLGVFETCSVASLITAADIMSKTTNVRLLKLKLARELGGKAYLIVGGYLGEIEACLEAAQQKLSCSGKIIRTTTIPVPDEALLQKMGLPLANAGYNQDIFNTFYREVGTRYGTKT